MGVVLALAAAVCYGASDFVAGLTSRRASSYAVAVLAQISALVVVAAGAVMLGVVPTGAALAWGALSGIGNGLGTAFLYRGLGSARMSVVAPLSAVGAAGLPVLVGVALGERPSPLAIAGIVLALPAVWLISRGESGIGGDTPSRSGVLDGLLAGAGFAVLFIALGRVPAGSGLWPLSLGQAVATATILVSGLIAGSRLLPPRTAAGPALIVGVLGGAATILYLFAVQRSLLSVAAVLTSLYPALTVLAAMLVLREHVHRGQALGLAAAVGSVVLITLS
ncbi:MAG TPA: EamA family transporter [Actinocatenispora sp.]